MFFLKTLLPPHRGVFLHLLLVGIPFRFGLLPTGFGRGMIIPKKFMPHPCDMFGVDCTPVEAFAVRDFGVRFVLHYELAWVVWFTMRKTNESAVAFHKILLLLSVCSLLMFAWLQNFFHPVSRAEFEFDQQFFARCVFYYIAAIALSLWTLASHSKTSPSPMKWSIPANSVFFGAVINLFIATAMFQALWEGNVQSFYRSTVTPLVKICFALSACHTALHGILLLRIRTFLNMPQLRTICFYKVIVNCVLPFFWFPDISPHMEVDQRITFALRGVLLFTYLTGYLWAGSAEGVSRILSSEKED